MNFAGFVQDDWRVTPKVIVNLGLRYMYVTPMKDANNNFGNFDPTEPGWFSKARQGTARYGRPITTISSRALVWLGTSRARERPWSGRALVLFTRPGLETLEGQFGMQNDGSTAINAIPTAASILAGFQLWFHRSVAHLRAAGRTLSALPLLLPAHSAGIPPSRQVWRHCGLHSGQATVFPAATGGEMRRRHWRRRVPVRPDGRRPESRYLTS